VVSQVKLIAEPWDVGEGGYQVGEFPPLWTEWNGKYRDTVRDVWRGQANGVRELAYRLSGSSDLYQDDGRRPYASINFVTAHDGFTLRDLTSYDDKHNEANGEDNLDGTDDNRSWNCGVEGPSDDPAVEALRLRQAKNLLSTLLLSTGVPMLTMGDELRRTQGGNNNAYVQDNEISWVHWDLDPSARELLELTTSLIRVRRQHPVFRQRAFFSGHDVSADGVKDVAWFGPTGEELTDEQWFDPSVQTLGMYLDGRGIRTRGPHGEAVVDDSFLVLLHMAPDDTELTLPGLPWAARYEVVLGTAETSLHETALKVVGRSVTLLRACR
jgi:glycogen operon protein